MSIKIHHGPPGSYKTSGAIWDDLVPQVKKGRHIVTNVRGFSKERARKEFPDIPDSFEVTFVDSSSPEGAEQWSRFFHWAPLGAFFFIDEAQNVFLSDDKIYKSAALDCDLEGRPKSWQVAWTMHRHFNWDFVLTCQNLDQLRKDIRQVSEACYKHKNNALLGLKGRYSEGFHLADVSGASASHFLSIRSNIKINKKVFDLYDSTSTGTVTDTIGGTPLWKNPRVVFLLAVLVFAVGFALVKSGGNPFRIFHHKENIKASDAQSIQNTVSGRGVSSDSVANIKGGSPDVDPPFWTQKWRVSGSWSSGGHERILFEVTRGDGIVMVLSDAQLVRNGFRVAFFGGCSVRVAAPSGSARLVDCLPFEYVQDPRVQRGSPAAGSDPASAGGA